VITGWNLDQMKDLFPAFCMSVTLAILSACGRLPADFRTLPLEKQVQAYE
jgi:hypothetical protein